MMKYLLIILFTITLYACENTRHSIGVTGKPLSTNFEENIKMNYKIIFGKVRSKKVEEDDD